MNVTRRNLLGGVLIAPTFLWTVTDQPADKIVHTT